MLLALVLVSGAGVLAFGLVSLWSSARDAERIAEVELRRSAQGSARALRELLLDARGHADVPVERTFTVAEGALVVPDDVGWLDLPPQAPLSEGEQEALRLEFGLGDRRAARALLATLPEGDLGAALCAERDGDLAARNALLARRDARPGWLLLFARARQPQPATAARTLQHMAPEEALALLARVAEADPARSVSELTAAVERAARWRATLRLARGVVPRLATGPVAVGGELVLPRLDGDVVRGGVVVPLEAHLTGLRERVASPWSGHLGLGSPTTESAIVVLPGIAFVEPLPAPTGARPVGLALLLVVLTLVCVLGAFLAIRVLRREAAAMAARAEFLTTVTHELKTPLAGIRVVAEMLEDGTIDGEAKRREYHAMLVGESERLTTLVENVLDLGRVERRERAYDLRDHELGQLTRDVVELFAPAASRSGLEVVFRAGRPATVNLDRGAFVQALLNVLENARKYAASGRRVEVEQDGTEVRVRDHGPGVPAADAARIFDRFVRGGAHAEGSVPGLGLGLHLAREIVRAHGGELRLEAPEHGDGARFVFEFPEVKR